MRRTTTTLLYMGLLGAGALLAGKEDPTKKYEPRIAPASKEGEQAIRRFSVPAGFTIELFAAEPMLAHPVAIGLDEKGRVYVCETFRHKAGVTDNRSHMYWVSEDLAARTVEDRVAMMKRHLKDRIKSWTVEHERLRLLEDADGDGKADKATVFADGFNDLADGIAAGVLARRGNVYYTCLPHLWLLKDTKGTGQADVRKSLHYGFGLHVAFLGHDLHGLRFGPDGRLYFSMGDRGFNVKTHEGKTLEYPLVGAVLRCNPDGSELEVVHTGLRNPQELAFDDHGNLFTVDNNADGGDRARLVYIVEGGDSGWRMSYQYMDFPTRLGPWNAERLWQPRWDGQSAYHLPPLVNLSDGPSGLCYNPGVTAFPDRYKSHFFLCDFRGASGRSGVRSFAVKPKGAFFEMHGDHQFFWSMLATDCDFGPDGSLYVSDWVEGWDKTGKGRIYRVFDAALARDAKVLEVKKLLAEGFTQRKSAELARLLEHDDQRIRQEAQFTLAERGKEGTAALAGVLKESKKPLARLHAVWGLGQIGRQMPATPANPAFMEVTSYLQDADAEVRCQAMKVLGEGRWTKAEAPILELLDKGGPRERFFAAQALGRLKLTDAVAPLLGALRKNNDQDHYLRHACVNALAEIGKPEALENAAKDSSPAVRLGVLLALRRLQDSRVALFLEDSQPALALEAARAINDVPIVKALPALAALAKRAELPEALAYRVINANFRLGEAPHANAVAAMAARPDLPTDVRYEAVRALGDWAKPSGRDRILGAWRPLPERDAAIPTDALKQSLGGIFTGPDRVRQEAARVAGRLGIKEVVPVLTELVRDPKREVTTRVEALYALDTLKTPKLADIATQALDDGQPRLRAAARRLMAKHHPAQAIPVLEEALAKGETIERQQAFATLAETRDPRAETLLRDWLGKLLAGSVSADVQLDLLEAAGKRKANQEIAALLAKVEASRKPDDPLAAWRECLSGGDAASGRSIFVNRTAVSCLRCHKIDGQGGDVGPDLTHAAKDKTREYLLEALVLPNKQIAKGHETVLVELKNGTILRGVLRGEDDKTLKLITPEGQPLEIDKSRIFQRGAGPSSMPDDLIKHLSKQDLRDLVEFLAGRK